MRPTWRFKSTPPLPLSLSACEADEATCRGFARCGNGAFIIALAFVVPALGVALRVLRPR